MQKTENSAKHQLTIFPQKGYRRISINEKTFSINDLKSEIKAVCQSCGAEDYPSEKFVLEVLKKTGEEMFFCLKCWSEKYPAMSWVGVFCLIFFTEKGIGARRKFLKP